MDLKETYNKIAKDWHNDHQQDEWWIDGTQKFISLLPQGAEILDVGCGSGAKTKYLTKNGFKVMGIDFSESFIEIARREVPTATFGILDMRELGSLSQDFDAIFAQASLLHIPRKEVPDVLTAFVSKLKPGGYLYIAVKGKRVGHPDEEIKEENDYGYTYERFFSYFTMEELDSYLNALNLEVIYRNARTSGKTEWLQIIGRQH